MTVKLEQKLSKKTLRKEQRKYKEKLVVA